ncbi:ergothioneine biosynthesis protein EgtB [Aureitalea marina]|uniref:Sulfatase maturase n=1 Tax=Aureitalea marina TaxID=930804 RepID=A0A2S7KR18_9FLAO|nr:ergothioneine biosynthesis protein EgtB [Aureitalea marina]PQB05066.1 sulfatase maturase [Aureitalea marina]
MIHTQNLVQLFSETRQLTEDICKPLGIEDYVVQPTIDVSPPKWHLGHTTWFFEEFILKPHKQGYRIYHQDFAFVFNSYYENVGKRVIRSDRGNLSRPGVTQVFDYRHYVTAEMKEFLQQGVPDSLMETLLIGIHHEKQHQELLRTDIKYILGNNPLLPALNTDWIEHPIERHQTDWITIPAGIYEIGHAGTDFCYDNELGKHQVYLGDFQISNKLVTNAEFIEFIAAGGYQDFNLWHADGWTWAQENQITAPMYWHQIDGSWHYYSTSGLEAIDPEAPLAHISYYEAFAYSQWKDCRLPTEFEWEVSQKHFNWGLRWEWTESAYLPYPGYTKAAGAIGEYNGKFMVNQKVLRGGSVATSPVHTRHTYRNFFQPELRWQFTGLRLARS